MKPILRDQPVLLHSPLNLASKHGSLGGCNVQNAQYTFVVVFHQDSNPEQKDYQAYQKSLLNLQNKGLHLIFESSCGYNHRPTDLFDRHLDFQFELEF